MTFVYVSGRRCLDFACTRKRRRSSAPEELLTLPHALSDWAVQAGLLGVELKVTGDELVSAIALREEIFRTVTARTERQRSSLPTSGAAHIRDAPGCTSTRRAWKIGHWCGMGSCGNEHKVRAFRERQRAVAKG